MKKKLLFRIGSLQSGGAERMLIDIVNNLDSNLYDITLLLNVKSGVFINDLNKNITLKYLYKELEYPFISRHIPVVSKIIRTLKHNFYYNFSFLIQKFILKEKEYDTIIFFLQDLASTYNFFKSKNKIIWVHEIISEAIKSNTSQKKQLPYFNNFNKIIAISNEVKNDLISILPSLENKITVIHNPINCNRISELSNNSQPKEFNGLKNKLKIISIGRIIPSKGFHRLIELKQKLDNEKIEAEIFIIGQVENIKFFNELKNLIEASKVSIKFLGVKENPYPYIKNADIMIHPSIHEGYGLVVAESLFLQTPVIASCINVYKEFAKEEVFYVSNNDESFSLETIEAIKKIQLGEKKGDINATNILDIKNYINKINTIF